MIDTGAEWSAFTHSENQEKSRVGSPMTEMLHDKGLTTKIHWKDTDAQGQPLSPRKKETMKRLRTWQKRVRISKAGERNLQLALSEINRMSSALGLPERASEMASVIYRSALNDNLVQGRSIEGVASGCLYIACRKQGIPRSLDEFESVARVGRNEIARTYRCIVADQDLEMEPVNPKQFVPRFCSELAAGRQIQRRATQILEDAAKEGLTSGKSPTGLAGAAIYIAAMLCNERRTQGEIADVVQVTEVTIRNRYQEQLTVVEEIEQ
jgi:transcription initiation factor TFIIB